MNGLSDMITENLESLEWWREMAVVMAQWRERAPSQADGDAADQIILMIRRYADASERRERQREHERQT
jgi:hypothetical protein